MLVVTQRRRPRLPQLSVNGTWASEWATSDAAQQQAAVGNPSTAGECVRLDCITGTDPAAAAVLFVSCHNDAYNYIADYNE
jgi:hypothetical protein